MGGNLSGQEHSLQSLRTTSKVKKMQNLLSEKTHRDPIQVFILVFTLPPSCESLLSDRKVPHLRQNVPTPAFLGEVPFSITEQEAGKLKNEKR